jgi:hypothetical protein
MDDIKMDKKETGWRETELDLYFSGQGQVACCCDFGNEHSGSTKKGVGGLLTS